MKLLTCIIDNVKLMNGRDCRLYALILRFSELGMSVPYGLYNLEKQNSRTFRGQKKVSRTKFKSKYRNSLFTFSYTQFTDVFPTSFRIYF